MEQGRIFLRLSHTPLEVAPGAELWISDADADGRRLSLALSHTGETPARGETEVWAGAAITPSPAIRTNAAQALLCNFMSVTAEVRDEFNEWYDEEHLPRLAATPGVLSAVRYHNEADALRPYLAAYRLESAGVQVAEAWKAAADTPWTRRMQRFIRNYRRLLFAPAKP